MPGPRKYNQVDPAVPNRLRYWRVARDMTIEQLADAMGTTYQTIQRYETGKLPLTDRLMQKLAKILLVSPADLVATDEDALDAEAREIAERYRLLDAQTKKLVKGVFEQVEEFRGRPGDKKSG